MPLKTCWKKKTAHACSQFGWTVGHLLLNCLNAAQREMRQVIQKIKVESQKNVVRQSL